MLKCLSYVDRYIRQLYFRPDARVQVPICVTADLMSRNGLCVTVQQRIISSERLRAVLGCCLLCCRNLGQLALKSRDDASYLYVTCVYIRRDVSQ